MHRLDDPLSVNEPAVLIGPPHPFLLILRSPPPRLDRGRIHVVRIHMSHLHIGPLTRPSSRIRDPLLALAADISRVVEFLGLAARDGADFALVETGFGFDGCRAGLEGAETQGAADEGPEVGDVDDDDGGGGFACVPV